MRATELDRDTGSRIDRLHALYEAQLTQRDDAYLREHCRSAFIAGSERVFRFYLPWITGSQRILDWGCRHAPDAVLLRDHLGPQVTLEGCDVIDPDAYSTMYQAAAMNYRRLDHPYRLPYEDSSFDAVIASGVLEHVPMDYESLKELWRVLRPGGRLVITYLPNRSSLEEYRLRLRGNGAHHRHRYSRAQLSRLLGHAGFAPLVIGYQTQLDRLPSDSRSRDWMKTLVGRQLSKATSCLCAVAERVSTF